jgi:imidazolonepropionase-like amidohydrolase
MSMPPPKSHPIVLIATGCVVQVNPTTGILLFKDVAKIKALHPYFAIGMNAEKIVGQGASVTPGIVGTAVHLTHKSVKVTSKLQIWRIRKGKSNPEKVPGPHRMDPKHFYWLMKR